MAVNSLARFRVTIELIDSNGLPQRRDVRAEVVCLDTGRCPVQVAFLTTDSPRLSVDVQSEIFKVLIGDAR